MTAAERDALWHRRAAVVNASLAEYRRLDSLLHLAIAEASGIPSLVPLVTENRARVNAWLDAFRCCRARSSIPRRTTNRSCRRSWRAAGCRGGGDARAPRGVGVAHSGVRGEGATFRLRLRRSLNDRGGV
jgi:hypothetical protein